MAMYGPRTLGPDEVHVWRIHLDAATSRLVQLRSLLSEDERHRADQFRQERHRLSWAVSRAGLRLILARYTGLAPAEIRFCYGPYGKPALMLETALRFNLSHTENLALVAVASGREVGVDVEHVRTDLDFHGLARTAFAPGEIAQMALLPSEQRPQGFFSGWCRKEAFIKAVGLGISFGLNRFEVTLTPGEPAELLSVDRPGVSVHDWSLLDLDPGHGCVGALAVQGKGWTCSLHDALITP